MNPRSWKLRAACVLFVAACALRLSPQALDPAWTRPVTPHRIAGNLFYVGTEDLAAYLIVTAQGDILINSTLVQNVPQIKKNVETLGFTFDKIKILLISHAHYDHCAGSALIKQMTGAKILRDGRRCFGGRVRRQDRLPIRQQSNHVFSAHQGRPRAA